MDRFIVMDYLKVYVCITYLKSNMDRFIDNFGTYIVKSEWHLKSNMDRFIASSSLSLLTVQQI